MATDANIADEFDLIPRSFTSEDSYQTHDMTSLGDDLPLFPEPGGLPIIPADYDLAPLKDHDINENSLDDEVECTRGGTTSWIWHTSEPLNHLDLDTEDEHEPNPDN